MPFWQIGVSLKNKLQTNWNIDWMQHFKYRTTMCLSK